MTKTTFGFLIGLSHDTSHRMVRRRNLFWPEGTSCKEGVIFGWELADGWVVCDVLLAITKVLSPDESNGLQPIGTAFHDCRRLQEASLGVKGDDLVVSLDERGFPNNLCGPEILVSVAIYAHLLSQR